MATDLTIYNADEAMVADLVAKDKAQQHDHTTPEGEKALRSWVYRIKCGCGDIEKSRKAGKAGLLKMGKLIDAKAKELTAPLREIESTRMKPITEREAKEKAEKDAFLAKQEEERAAKEEADRKELEELRAQKAKAEQAERDKKIAEDAKAEVEQKAKDAAEKALQDAKDAQAKAEQDKIDAAAKAEQDKQDAIIAERQKALLAQQAKDAETQAAEDAKRAEEKVKFAAEKRRTADVNHRKTVERDVFLSLKAIVLDDIMADAIMEAITTGTINNLTITY